MTHYMSKPIARQTTQLSRKQHNKQYGIKENNTTIRQTMKLHYTNDAYMVNNQLLKAIYAVKIRRITGL